MTIAILEELFVHTLKDVLYAERRILKTLPKMERKATDPKLKTAFWKHREETEDHIVRVEAVFDSMGKPARGAKCDAIVGHIDEAESLMADIGHAETMNAAIISLAQAIEHYEIARYSTLIAWARQMGNQEADALLRSTLEEEYATDKALTKLALERTNAMPVA